MFKRILTILAAAVLALCVLIPAASLAQTVMYVYTANGKTLNVRSEPVVGNNLVTELPFGSEVYVDYHLGNGWTALFWTGSQYYHVYVQTRFLVSTKPVKPVTPTPASVGDTASTVAELNAIFKTYRQVRNPYLVLVRPTRASGWVNVRFAPTKQSELLGQYHTNDQLLVIAEMTNWYQVEDPNTGAVGYVSDKYVVR